MPILRRALYLPVLFLLLAPSAALAQKTFEVVSIRENLTPPGGAPSYGPTPDGYHMVNMPLTAAILTAYVQSNSGAVFSFGNISGLQDLMQIGRYDIDARISEADRAAWQDPKLQPEMLKAMLADRFHLRVHRERKQQDIFLLQVARGGPKFQPTKPDEAHPGAIALPGGGFAAGSEGMSRYYDIQMATLASLLSPSAARTIRDETNLLGHYDLIFPQPSFADSTPAIDASVDTRPTVFSVLAGLGLKLEPAKGDVEMLVIDHIEKPTAN